METSKTIKGVRKKLLLSQQDFAKELGVSFGSINRWENGRCHPNYIDKRKIVEYVKRHTGEIIVLDE